MSSPSGIDVQDLLPVTVTLPRHQAEAHALLAAVRARLQPRPGSTGHDLALHDARVRSALADLRSALLTLTEVRPPCPADVPDYF